MKSRFIIVKTISIYFDSILFEKVEKVEKDEEIEQKKIKMVELINEIDEQTNESTELIRKVKVQPIYTIVKTISISFKSASLIKLENNDNVRSDKVIKTIKQIIEIFKGGGAIEIW